MSYDALSSAAMADGSRVFVLIDLYFGGEPLRIAATELDVTDAAAGLDYHYTAGCDEIAFTEPFDLLDDAGAGVSISMDLHLPVDVAQLIARGEQLAGARVVVSQWVEGTDWSLRREVLDGEVSDPIYDEAGEDGAPVSLTAQPVAESIKILSPPPDHIVTGANWANATSLTEEHLGVPYPTIIGTPGVVATDLQADGRITGSTACWVDYTDDLAAGGGLSDGGGRTGLVAVIADHHVTATRVIACTDEYPTGYRFSVTNDYDAAGHPVAVLLWFQSAATTPADIYEYDLGVVYGWSSVDTDAVTVYGLGHSGIHTPMGFSSDTQIRLYISWLDPLTGGGGKVWRGRLLRDAGDVIEWALSESGRLVDWGRCAAAAPALAGFKIDARIDGFSDRYDWLMDEVIPLLPVTLAEGPQGWYYIVWRYDARPEDAVQHLDFDADPQLEIVSKVETDSSKIANDFTLSYALSVRTGNHIAVARLGDLAYSQSAPRSIPSEICRVSQLRRARLGPGAVVSSEMTTDVVYDDATAHLINRWRSYAYALAEERIVVRAPEGAVTRIERGSVVTVTRGGLYLDTCVGLVGELAHEGEMVEFPITLRRDPARDLRGAG